jgi:signal peptidase II
LNLIRKYWVLFFIAGIVIGLDQWAKSLVRTLAIGEIWLPSGLDWLSPYARIIHWYNTGAAFGSFQGFGWVFTILAFLVVGLIIYYFPQVDARDWWLKLAMGLQMGGALGNVVDRLTNNGKVTDFISVGNFAVFNLADASISVGVVILLAGAWFKEKGGRKQAGDDLAPTEQELPDLPSTAETGVNHGESSGE